MKKVVWRIGVLIAALLSALLLTLPMLAMGLVVDMAVVSLLMFIIAALIAAICASWFGTLFAPDHTYTRLLPVVGICEVIAIVLAILVFVLATLMDVFLVIPVVGVVIVAVSASWATWHFRRRADRLGMDCCYNAWLGRWRTVARHRGTLRCGVIRYGRALTYSCSHLSAI